ncbi:alpha/beta hydrolase [Umezawaea tangerina]|uniref:Alpha/beta hydrolase family protein n=1 Tax=Umezawaea tangerina TaxID=84725 RepID=A0A2T0SG90_9PSEU|nr:alpha/beta hydrolase [Umezawaea tangerina]PRY32422.1 alpha/beta hydrolase family protein [Umezawaea tangerina]
MTGTLTRAVVGVIAGALILGGTPVMAHADAPPVPSLAWTDCGDGFQCATADVPLDYHDPGGPKIGLGVTRKQAGDPTRRIGSLFLNPGGPGGGTDDLVRLFSTTGPAELRERFDIIGFDPRGVARSSPLACQSQDEYTQAWSRARSRPAPGAFDRALAQGKEFADACERESARLLPFVGTEYVARDLDLMRQAVGDEKLSYFGISYGTYIGTVYANLFPDRVRVLALDGAYNPETYANRPYRYDFGQFVAVESALTRLFDWCRRTPAECGFGDGDPRAAFVALQNSLDAEPVRAADGAFVGNGATLTFNVVRALGGGLAAWPEIAQGLLAAQRDRSGGLLEAPPASLLAANTSVECADRLFPTGKAQLRVQLTLASVVAPLTGPAMAYAVPSYDHAHATACTQWPVRSRSRFAGPFDAPTAPPILVVGSTGDPDTPFPDAVALASTLHGGRLLTYRGEGHTGFLNSRQCVGEHIVAYLLDGTLPAEGTTCED